MKPYLLIILIFLAACNSGEQGTVATTKDSSNQPPAALADSSTADNNADSTANANPAISKTPLFSNAAFKEVKIQKIDATHYRVTGKGRLFEAAFSWVVEDGHNELLNGHQTASAGAPEWGSFDFTFELARKANTTPHLILLEYSAKDGSRQHELPIPLPH
ncbi:MAG: sporulation protein [Flaviaesturariibacter sp.]|nr:sporulation protein [Flaviaesturariibacter sp.]